MLGYIITNPAISALVSHSRRRIRYSLSSSYLSKTTKVIPSLYATTRTTPFAGFRHGMSLRREGVRFFNRSLISSQISAHVANPARRWESSIGSTIPAPMQKCSSKIGPHQCREMESRTCGLWTSTARHKPGLRSEISSPCIDTEQVERLGKWRGGEIM